jgi:CRP/FNR family transcriptional regulator, cyclic AMP receptor protein
VIDRFTGSAGAANLREAMLQQRVVEHNAAVAEKLIAVGTLFQFEPGEVILKQDSDDQFVFHILAGESEVVVNERPVARRATSEVIGEMSAIDASAPRSATVRAVSATVCLRVGAPDFIAVANEFPSVWRSTARIIGERLRQRRRFHRPPNSKPVLFVGSSAEGLSVAKHIQLGMKHNAAEVRIWTDGVFGPGGVAVDKLLEQVEQADFAVFVFGPDDTVASRDETHQAPRDNVIFEMGMFISQLGRERTYIVKEQKTEIKIPSDLLGITPITYVADARAKMEVVLGPVCTVVAKQVQELGPL